MHARNSEFTNKGIMNVDSSLEAILLFKSLSAEQQKTIGSCQVDEALASWSGIALSRLRKGEDRSVRGRWQLLCVGVVAKQGELMSVSASRSTSVASCRGSGRHPSMWAIGFSSHCPDCSRSLRLKMTMPWFVTGWLVFVTLRSKSKTSECWESSCQPLAP